MTSNEYLTFRNSYAYPSVGLDGTLTSFAHCNFSTTQSMEHYHQTMLRSIKDEQCVLGYLSVIYWGHYSGKNGKSLANRALGKVKLAKKGFARKSNGRTERILGVEDIGVAEVATCIREATDFLDSFSYNDAVIHLTRLPQLGFAFASKVCSFLQPDHCGVIDSVIARKFDEFDFNLNGGKYVRTSKINADKYMDYCGFLSKEAKILNDLGPDFMWRDLDGSLCSWRAVDVERAIYRSTPQ